MYKLGDQVRVKRLSYTPCQNGNKVIHRVPPPMGEVIKIMPNTVLSTLSEHDRSPIKRQTCYLVSANGHQLVCEEGDIS